MILFKSYKNIPILIVLQSFLVAFYADIKCINWSLSYGFLSSSGDEGFMSMLYMGPIVLIVLCVVFRIGNVLNRIGRTYVIITSLLLVFYFLTNEFIGPPRIKFLFFFVFVIMSMTIPSLVRINARIFIKAIMFFPSFTILRIDKVFSYVSDWSESISMDASYAFLVPICATIVYLFIYYKDECNRDKIITIGLSIINLIFFIQILQYGSRGPLLSVVLLVTFLYLFKHPSSESMGVRKKEHWQMMIIVGILIMYFSFYFVVEIIDYIADIYGSKLHFVEKILRLSAENDLSNGRDILNVVAISGIIDQPFLGHGLDRFDANTGMLYPHNFVLQMLYDGGLAFFTVMMVPLVKRSANILKNCSIGEYAVFAVLFFSSVPGALFSGDMWSLARLWLFFGFVLSSSFVVEEENI